MFRILLVVNVLTLLAVILIAAMPAPHPMPRCPEDAIAYGFGDFEDGWYESYRCIAVDDLPLPDWAP